MFTRRHFLKTWAALPVALQSQHVLARQLSDKPIRLLVAASSGTTVDTVARFLAPPLAGLVGAPGTADAMDIHFSIIGQVIVENVRNIVNVQTAGGDVGSDKHLQLIRTETS